MKLRFRYVNVSQDEVGFFAAVMMLLWAFCMLRGVSPVYVPEIPRNTAFPYLAASAESSPSTLPGEDLFSFDVGCLKGFRYKPMSV